MASGDNFKVWFPEMIVILKSRWNATLSWEEIAELCHTMSEYRDTLRAQKGINNPLAHSDECGGMHELLSTPITIRSLLFAIKKEGMIDILEFERLDYDWKKYKRKHKLDGCGLSPK